MILLQNGIQEVSGSIPLISTKIKDSCSRKGHGSLIVITKVMSGYLIQIELAEKGLPRRFIGHCRPNGPALYYIQQQSFPPTLVQYREHLLWL